ncbi:hypothetical protein ACJ72_03744 [Emergomyces africanus]|uniref:Uncharacterized protein n=1 Tax=Emergomyces africanus TaxID=1955775 RepID=A0A1B7NYR3_9EURO|nr:hypothetical protein ACJ72_03744 [Emergomyces africanus]
MANVDFDQAELELGEQPNMGALADGFKQAATGLSQASSQLEKFRNIPPIAQSSAILSQLSQMQSIMQQTLQTQQEMQKAQQEMQEALQEIREAQQEIRQNIAQIRSDMIIGFQTIEFNSIARLQNSAVRRSDIRLTILRDYRTNTDIPDFPETSAHLSNMSGRALNSVLTALNLPTDGTTAEKKRQLRLYIGLPDV